MTDIASLGIEIRSDGVLVASKRLRDMEKESKKAETATERLERQAKKLEQTAGRLGRTLSMSVTAPLVGIAAASVKMATTFDSELTRINTLVGVSRDQIAEYRKEILTLAPALGQQPAEMASALFAVTSAGQRGAAAMRTLEAASKASAIGLGDTRSIALAATAAVTAYGEANLSSSDAVEILVGTVEQGNLEASELAGVLGRVIGIAAEAGVSFQDAGAFIAAFTRQGVDAAQAVTGLRGVLATLVREPTAQAIEAFDKMGMSAEGFKQAVREEGFITAFQELIDRAEETGVSLGQIIPEVEALTGALSVFASEGSNAAEIADAVGAAVGTLDDRLRAAIEMDPALAFAQLRSELSTLLIELSANILPAALELVEILRDASEAFRELSPETQKMVVQTGALAAAIGPLLIGLSATIGALRTLRPLVVFMAGPAGLIALAAGAGLFIGHKLDQYMKDVAAGTRGLSDELKKAATEWTEFNREVADAHRQIIEIDMARLERQIESVAQAMSRMPGGAQETQIKFMQDLQDQYATLVIQLERNERLNRGLDESTDNLAQTIEGYILALLDAGEAQDKKAESTNNLSGVIQSYIEDMIEAASTVEDFDGWINRLADSMLEDQRRVEAYAQAMLNLSAAFYRAATGRELFGRSAGAGDVSEEIEASFEDAVLKGVSSGLTRALSSMSAQDIMSMSFGEFGALLGNAILTDVGASVGESLGEKLGEELGETLTETFGDTLGEALGDAIPVVGKLIGSLVGNWLGDILGLNKDPILQVAGRAGFSRDPAEAARRGDTTTTALGDIFFRFRKIEKAAQTQIINALQQFDSALAGIITDEAQLDEARQALENMRYVGEGDNISLEEVLAQRFQTILRTFDGFIQGFVNEAATLEEQIQRLADVQILRARQGLGDLGGGDATIQIAGDLARAGETVAMAFQRLLTVTETLETALDLTGNTVADSAVGVVEFGDALTKAFGDDLQRLTQGLNRIFETFFSDEERFEQQAEASKARATELFRSLGVDITDALFTESGFRDLFDNLFGSLSAEDTAILIEAGVAVSDFIDANEGLSDLVDDVTESVVDNTAALEEAARAAEEAARAERERAQALREFMGDIDRDLLRFVNPTQAAFMDLRDEMAALYTQALDLGASEEQLRRVRELQQRSIAKFTNDLKISILELADDLFGTEETFTDVGNAIVRSTENVRDAVIRNLERIDEWLDRSLLGNFSPLTPTERLGEAQSAFDAAFAALNNGDLSVLENLPALADALLSEGAGFFGTSTAQYRELFDAVRAAMVEASKIDPPAEMKPPNWQQVEDIKGDASSFRETLDELNKVEALADLGRRIGTLATVTGDLPSEIASDLGFTEGQMKDILEGVGADAGTKTGEELEDYFNDVIGGITGETGTNALLGSLNTLIGLLNRYFRDEFVDELAAKMPNQDIDPPPDTSQPRGLATSSFTSSSTSSTAPILERIDSRLRNLEKISGTGFATVADEERRTRQTMARPTATARV